MPSKKNCPLSFEVAVRDRLVSGLESVTVAPATTLPCGSLITPLTDDVLVWPKAMWQDNKKTRSVPNESTNLNFGKPGLFIWFLQESCYWCEVATAPTIFEYL